MTKRHYLLSILAIIIAGFLVVSCTVQRDNVPQTPENRQTRFVPRDSPDPITRQSAPYVSPRPRTFTRDKNRRDTNDPLIGDRDRNRNNINNAPMGINEQDRAEKIANAAAKQKEVESASCVITGNTAMVGIQFNKQYKGDLTDAIKR